MAHVPFPYVGGIPNGMSKKPVLISTLALWAGFTRQHVTRLCRAGVVPGAFQTRGGHWRVRPSAALARWIAAEGDRRGRPVHSADVKGQSVGLMNEERELKAMARAIRTRLRAVGAQLGTMHHRRLLAASSPTR